MRIPNCGMHEPESSDQKSDCVGVDVSLVLMSPHHVRYDRIASISATHDTTQFGDSICPICIST
jgi:hypothetical protein